MKFFSSVAATAAIITLTAGCGILGPSSSSSSSAKSTNAGILSSQVPISGMMSGQTSGAALKNLYSEFRHSGKIDLHDVNTILDIAKLSSGIQCLKNNNSDNSFFTDFAKGLILGSGSLVNKGNSEDILSKLTELAGTDLSSITSAASALTSSVSAKAADTISKVNTANDNVSTAVNALTNIFGLFK